MRKVEAVLETGELPDVREALREIGVRTMRVSEVKEELVYVDKSGPWERAAEEGGSKSRLSIIVPDDEADRVILTLLGALKGGGIDDGSRFVSSIEHVVRLEATGFFDDVI